MIHNGIRNRRTTAHEFRGIMTRFNTPDHGGTLSYPPPTLIDRTYAPPPLSGVAFQERQRQHTKDFRNRAAHHPPGRHPWRWFRWNVCLFNASSFGFQKIKMLLNRHKESIAQLLRKCPFTAKDNTEIRKENVEQSYLRAPQESFAMSPHPGLSAAAFLMAWNLESRKEKLHRRRKLRGEA